MKEGRTGVSGSDEGDGSTRLTGTTSSTNSNNEIEISVNHRQKGREDEPMNVVLDLVGRIEVDDVFDVFDI